MSRQAPTCVVYLLNAHKSLMPVDIARLKQRLINFATSYSAGIEMTILSKVDAPTPADRHAWCGTDSGFKRPSRMRNRSHLLVSWRDLRAYQEARHAACCTLHPSKPLHPHMVKERSGIQPTAAKVRNNAISGGSESIRYTTGSAKVVPESIKCAQPLFSR